MGTILEALPLAIESSPLRGFSNSFLTVLGALAETFLASHCNVLRLSS